MRRTIPLVLVVALAAGRARAADPPKFEFGKREEVKQVTWLASANLGLIWTTGNSSTVTLSGGANVSRNDGKNKIALEVNGAYSRASIRQAIDLNGNGTIEPNEVSSVGKITAETWLVKARYDRFFTENNAGYVAAFAGGDVPAGKDLVAGGQAGYARHLYQTKTQDLAAELGYDFSFVDYAAADANPSQVSIHSMRAFVGYQNAVTDNTQFAISLEALFNLNPLDTPTGHAGPFEDVRLLGKASLTTKLWKTIAFRFSFTAKFDNQPAPLPPLGPANLPYAPGFVPAADKLDTITEAALIVNFI